MKYRFFKQGFCLTLLFVMLLISLDFVHAQANAEAGVFEDYEVSPGTRIEVPVEIRNVQDLYAVDIEIQFDPEIIAVEDANPDLASVQPALGMFLDAGLTLFNTVDNETGTLRFAMTQVNPSEPKSGEGVILVLSFRGVAEGESDLTVSMVEISDRAGEAVPVDGVHGSIVVSSGAAAQEGTAIPVQDPALMIAIPTLEPTPEPTKTPEQAQALSSDASLAEENTESEESDLLESGSSEEDPASMGFSLLKYWWIVALVVLAAIGMGFYLIVSRKSR